MLKEGKYTNFSFGVKFDKGICFDEIIFKCLY